MNRADEIERLKQRLESIGDPRDGHGKRHAFVDILCIALVAMLAGADDADAFEEFGLVHKTWLRQWLTLEHGIPSQDTFLRVFAAIDPVAFRTVFREWVGAIRQTFDRGHVAIDGKTARRSFDTASGAKAIHTVSAWLSEDGLVLGQQAVAEKSNEIDAIPELLALLNIRGTTVTIDAMGCQRAIAEKIVERKAHYILAVKDNQPTLRANIAGFFEDAERTHRPVDDPPPVIETATEVDSGHGRVVERKCDVSRDLSWVQSKDAWVGMGAIARVQSRSHDKVTGATSTDERLYIISHPTASATDVQRWVRAHWGIENRLHWVLDVASQEDQSRIRAKHAAENFAIIRHVVLNMIRAAPGKKKSVALRRKRCGWDLNYLLSVLVAAPTAD